MSKLSSLPSNEKAVDRYDDDDGDGGKKEEEEEEAEEEKCSKANGGLCSSKLTVLSTLSLSLGIAFGIGIGEDGLNLGKAVLDPV